MFPKCILIGVLGAATIVLSVDSASANTREQARAAFMQGRVAFKAGRFESAAKYLEEAYRLKPHPALLRYLGQSYLKLGQAPKAIGYFEKYLAQAPQAPDRKKVSARIVALKKALAEARAKAKAKRGKAVASGTADKAPVATDKKLNVKLAPTGEDDEMPDVIGKPIASPEERRKLREEVDREPSRWMAYTKWTTAVIGVGGLAAGLVFNVLASGKASDLEDAAKSNNSDLSEPSVAYNADHFAMQQDYKRFNTMALISYIAGGVLTATAVTLFILDTGGNGPAEKQAASFQPWIGTEGAGVAASFSF